MDIEKNEFYVKCNEKYYPCTLLIVDLDMSECFVGISHNLWGKFESETGNNPISYKTHIMDLALASSHMMGKSYSEMMINIKKHRNPEDSIESENALNSSAIEDPDKSSDHKNSGLGFSNG